MFKNADELYLEISDKAHDGMIKASSLHEFSVSFLGTFVQ